MTSGNPITVMTRSARVALVISWILLVGLGAWQLTNSASLANLHKTDKIACRFLSADASVRRQQAHNTKTTTVDAENSFIRDADAFLSLFKGANPKAKNAGAIRIFQDYVAAERALIVSIRDGTLQNVILSNKLASLGMTLADQLHC